MAEQKEYVKINFKGQEINIKRVWGGHRFTDSELKHLENGETIHIQAKNANGDDFECDGNIQKQEYNGFNFWGFKMLPFKPKEKAEGMFAGIKIKFNRVWGGHRFTDEEVQKLLAGETIHISGKKKNGNPFECDGKITEQNYKGKSFWGFKNAKSDKSTEQTNNSFDEVKKTLESGSSIESDDAESENVSIDSNETNNESFNSFTESDFEEDDLF